MVEGVKSSFQAFKHKKPSSCLSPKIFQMVKIASWVDGTEWLFKQNLWLFFLPKEDDLVCENGKGIVFVLGVKVQRPRTRWEISTGSLCQWCSPSRLPTPSRWMQLSSNSSRSVQLLSHVRLSATPRTAARQVSLFTNSQSLPKLMSTESMMPSNHLILCLPLLLLPSISSSIRVFSNESSRGQSIGISVSASVLPVNIQDWFPLGWTGLISVQSKGHSRVFCNTTVQKHQFFSTQLSL